MIYADNYVKNIVNGVSGGNEKTYTPLTLPPAATLKWTYMPT